MTRYVYTVQSDDEGCIGVFGSIHRAAKFCRADYEVSFPRGSLGRVKSGNEPCVVVTPPWDESGEGQITLSRCKVQ